MGAVDSPDPLKETKEQVGEGSCPVLSGDTEAEAVRLICYLYVEGDSRVCPPRTSSSKFPPPSEEIPLLAFSSHTSCIPPSYSLGLSPPSFVAKQPVMIDMC